MNECRHRSFQMLPSSRRGYVTSVCLDCGGEYDLVRCAHTQSKRRCLWAITNLVPGDPYCGVHSA